MVVNTDIIQVLAPVIYYREREFGTGGRNHGRRSVKQLTIRIILHK